MKTTQIKDLLHHIEDENNVEILYACEAGSRAYGYHSEDSDYDIRFIFRRTDVADYVRLWPMTDHIHAMGEGADVMGWDVGKTLKLMRNPQLYEWFDSPIVYHDSPAAVLLKHVVHNNLSPGAHFWHHYNQASNQWAHCQGDRVTVKRYLSAARHLVNCQWIVKERTPAPTPFHSALVIIEDVPLRTRIENLMHSRNTAREAQEIEPCPLVEHFIRSQLADLRPVGLRMPNSEANRDELEDTYRTLVLKR